VVYHSEGWLIPPAAQLFSLILVKHFYILFLLVPLNCLASNETVRSTPVQIYNSGVSQVAAGREHSLILKTDGSLWVTGRNDYGQLGDGTSYSTDGLSADKSTPVQIYTNGVSQVATRYGYSLIVKTDGSLWATGYNYDGQLGYGTSYLTDGVSAHKRTPMQIFANGVSQVSAGGFHSLILKTDGSLWVTGRNNSGQLGDGKVKKRVTPVQIYTNGVSQVAAGSEHSLILKTDGSLWATGRNKYGQLGNGTSSTYGYSADKSTPVLIFSSGVSQVAAGEDYSLILKTDGSLWATGQNVHGQLGDGTTTNRSTPVQILANGISQVSAGWSHSLIVKTDGSLWAVGKNLHGQLGDGTTTDKRTPVLILASGVSQVSAGRFHSLIVKTDGSLWAMGQNKYGQLGEKKKKKKTREVFYSSVNQMRAELSEFEPRAFGVFYLHPHKLSLSIQLSAVGRHSSYKRGGGYYLKLQTGLGGGNIDIGRCSVAYSKGMYSRTQIGLSYLRTWGNPIRIQPNNGYIGINSEVVFLGPIDHIYSGPLPIVSRPF